MATMSLQAAYDQARSYLEANQVEQAIGVAQHILEQYPENLEAHRILGEAYLASRQFDQAELAFGRVLHADPENIPAHVGLGITLERQGKLDRAVAEFEQALEVRPDMPELRGQLLRLYTDLWGAEGATLRLSRPGLARLYAKGHMLPQAIQEFRSVIEEHPDRFDARVGLAEALWRDGQEEAAAETCEAILAERADVLKANLLLGYIRLASGDESGEPYWRLAQQLDPYQQVARSLFEALPDVPPPDLEIPAWDETAWLEQRAREEEQRRAPAGDELGVQPAAFAAASADQADEDGFDSWLDRIDAVADEAPAAPPEQTPAPANDDFLASLLALDTPPLPAEPGSDLDSSSGVTPFSFDELDAGQAPPPPPRPVPDLEPAADELPAATGEDLEPFSLADLGLSEEEVAQLQGDATPIGDQPGGMEDLEPFSLADLGLSPDEVAELDAAATPTPSEPSAEAAMAGLEGEGLEPFSLADLGLTPEESALLGQTEAAPRSEEAPAPEVAPDLEPFSLEELGLSPEEIAALEAAGPPAETPPPEGAPAEPQPFDWPAAEPAEAADQGFDPDLGDLEPFSLDDLDLSATDDEPGMGALPPSLQPFSLDDVPPLPASPPPPMSVEPDEQGEASGGYSWQQPAAKDQPGFVRSEAGEPAQASIFDKLKQRASELPPEEPPPLSPVSDTDAAASGYFSNDEVSLRDDEPGAADRFAGGFRLPKEGAPGAMAAGLAAGLAAGAAAMCGARQDEAPAEQPASDEPELTPFSLEELGLSPEEIAQLQAAEAPAGQPASDEPELTPFSLEELGLSPEEIAQLEAADRGEQPPPATGETIVPGWSRGEEPELTPFAPDEAETPAGSIEPFSLDAIESGTAPAGSDEGIDETVGFGVEPFSIDDFDFDASPGATTPGAIDETVGAGVQPFSLDDLGLGEPSAPDDPSRELGLTPEELAGLDLGELEQLVGEPRPTTPLVSEDPAAALERLMALGRERGYVDLTDIIAVVSDPEAEAERIEEMGWALHNAGIQIRDGDEIIDMEGEAEELVAEEADEPAPAAPQPTFEGEPDLTPFSLSELGLSDEEIAALGLGEAVETPEPTPEPAASDEPELTPFSLEDLGLSPEEIAQLESAAQSAEAPAEPAPEPALAPPSDEPELTPFSLEDLGLSPEEIAQLESAAQSAEAPAESADDMFDFGLAATQPVEKVTKRTEPRAEEPPPTVDPADAAFQPAPLESLDDIWEQPTTPARAESEAPARVVLPPLSERQRETRRAEPAGSAGARRGLSRDEERYARREAATRRGRDEERHARRERRAGASWREQARPAAEFAGFLPTGDDLLDDYLAQLDNEPDNYGLALAIGRLCAQTGRPAIMAQAFKRVVRSGQGVEQLTETLEALVERADDPGVKQQLYRLLGDAYSKQGRYSDAMKAYDVTFGR